MTRKSKSRLTTSLRLGATAVAACFVAAPSWSNPVAPTVVNGSATFQQNGQVLTVTNTPGAIINWQQFNIAAGETTHFQQASASSTVLNRVLTPDPSTIFGTLSSNGHVWLVNPAGIMVGAGGRIDTAGFVASTLAINNTDFLAGRNLFVNDGTAKDVINRGEILTPSGGHVYLIGTNVSNEGIIKTPEGVTILAAGATVSLVDTSTPGIKVDITGAEGNATNLGQITAEAGRIGIAGVIVRNRGNLNASSVVSEGGRIFLKASQDAFVDGAGRIVTTGTKGGSVEVLGNRVAVTDQASIDASGDTGGGTILVGGDYQGKNPEIQNASITYFGGDAELKADATGNGNGGRVIVWADETTRVFGKISARGGAGGGDGGFVETSAKGTLDVGNILVDRAAPKGKAGMWLLDPSNIWISTAAVNAPTPNVINGGNIFEGSNYSGTPGDPAIAWSTIDTNLASGPVMITTSGSGAAGTAGNIFWYSGTFTTTNTNDLWLVAHDSIQLNGTSLTTAGGLKLIAGWDGNLPGNRFNDVTDYVIAGAGSSKAITILGGSYLNVAGTAAFRAGGTVSITESTVISTGAMSVSTAGALNVTGGASASALLKSNAGQTINVDSVTVTAGTGTAASAGIVSYGGQSITASSTTGGITLLGGASGQNNGASIANYNTTNSQTINAHNLTLTAGGSGATDFNDGATIYSSTGSQIINITGTSGSITLTGGSGGQSVAEYGGVAGAGSDSDCVTYAGANYCYKSNNRATISHRSNSNLYGQEINFTQSAGSITLTGGSLGAGNGAEIDNDSDSNSTPGAQTIGSATYRANISITGGSSGGKVVYGSDGKFHDKRNAAGIESNASSTIYAGTISLNAGTGTVAGAIIGGGNDNSINTLTIHTTGDVTLQGGSAGLVQAMNDPTKYYELNAPAVIGNEKDIGITLNVGGNLTMTSGSAAGSAAFIGALAGYGGGTGINAIVTGNISMTSTGSGAFIGSLADLSKSQLGGGNVTVTSDGNITLSASSSTYGGVGIGSYSDSYAGTVTVRANRNVNLTGGASYGATIGYLNPTVLYKNKTVNVTAGYGGSFGGNIVMGENSLIQAGANVSDVALNITLTANLKTSDPTNTSYGSMTLNKVKAGNGGGTVNAYSGHAILDQNGIGVSNIYGGTVYLSSAYGGSYGGFAISSDVVAANSVTGIVGTGSTYGGLYIRNNGTNLPATLSFNDNSTLNTAWNTPSVTYYYGGDISLGANHNLATIAGGIVKIAAGGSLTVPSGKSIGSHTRDMSLLAGATQSSTGTYGVNLAGSAALTVNGSIIGRNIGFVAPTINLNSNVTAYAQSSDPKGSFSSSNGATVSYTGIGFLANNFNADGSGAYLKSVYATGDISGLVTGDIALDNGAYFQAGNDIDLVLSGAGSTLTLSNGSSLWADAGTHIPSSINLDFSGRTDSGLVVDASSGTFVTASRVGTATGGGLHVKVKAAEIRAAVVSVDDADEIAGAAAVTNDIVTESASTSGNPTDTGDDAPPPLDTGGGGGIGGGGGFGGTVVGEVGGDAGSFGGGDADAGGSGNSNAAAADGEKTGDSGSKDADKQDEKTADKKDDKDDKEDKKSDDKDDKKDDKPAAKKVAQCGA